MKTNVKFTRNSPAVAYITPNYFALNYFNKGIEQTVDCSGLSYRFDQELVDNLSESLCQTQISRSNLVIILSAEMTLYSEHTFPSGLSDLQITELFTLQLSRRSESKEVNTYYDYFLLNKKQGKDTFGLFEARKDVLKTWMKVFKKYNLKPIAVLSEPIVLINYLIKNTNINDDYFQIFCTLSSRVFIVDVRNKHVEKIREKVIHENAMTAQMLLDLLPQGVNSGSNELNHPILVLGSEHIEGKGTLVDNFIFIQDYDQQKFLGGCTIKWMRRHYDLYKSVALA